MANFQRCSVQRSAEVDVSAEAFWRMLRDWKSLMEYAPSGDNVTAPLVKVELKAGHRNEILPCTRVAYFDTTKGFPPFFEETLLHADPEARRVYYNIEGVASGGMRNYLATAVIDELGPGRARVTCSSTFDLPLETPAAPIKEFLESVYDEVIIQGIATAVKLQKKSAPIG
jgi:Polyketide cyclase / dehydrase and lipid transport